MIHNNQGQDIGYIQSLTWPWLLWISQKPNLIIALLYIERKNKWKSCVCFISDGERDKSHKLTWLPLRLVSLANCSWSHDQKCRVIRCSENETGIWSKTHTSAYDAVVFNIVKNCGTVCFFKESYRSISYMYLPKIAFHFLGLFIPLTFTVKNLSWNVERNICSC